MNWTVTLAGVAQTTNEKSIVFTELNGTYLYNVSPVAGYSTNYSGHVQVNGGPVSVAIAFSNSTYPAIFTAAGLPRNTSWSVNATEQDTGKLSTGSSIGTTLTIDLLNGTYSLTATGPPGYYPELSVMKIIVDGAKASTVSIFFEPPVCAGCGGVRSPTFIPLSIYVLAGITVAVIVAAVVIALAIRGRRPPPVPPDHS